MLSMHCRDALRLPCMTISCCAGRACGADARGGAPLCCLQPGLRSAPAHAPAQQPEEGAGAHRKRAAEEPEEAPSKRHEGDGAAAAPHVGPAPAEEGAAGRFQGLVQSRVVQGGGAAPKQALAGQALQQRRPKPEPERGRGHPGAQPFVKPSMYDWIPPVSGAGSSSSSPHAL